MIRTKKETGTIEMITKESQEAVGMTMTGPRGDVRVFNHFYCIYTMIKAIININCTPSFSFCY